MTMVSSPPPAVHSENSPNYPPPYSPGSGIDADDCYSWVAGEWDDDPITRDALRDASPKVGGSEHGFTWDMIRPMDPEDAAWLLGFELARIGEVSEPPAGFGQHENAAFRKGWASGEATRDPEPDDADCPSDEDWDRMFADAHDCHEAEVIEAMGAVAARGTLVD